MSSRKKTTTSKVTKSAYKSKNYKNATHMPKASNTALKPIKSYPCVLIASCVLMLGFLFTNNLPLRIDPQLSFVIAAAVIFFIVMLRKANRELLFGRISVIWLVLLGQCLLYFAGLFYAAYTKYALQQFYLNTGALFVFTAAYVCFIRDPNNIKRFITIFSSTIVIVSLVSIELATSGLLRVVIESITSLFKTQIPTGYAAFETNTRIRTVLGNPNVFAQIAVLALFLSLWYCSRAGERTYNNFVHMSLAVANGIAFVLCFSLGTILCYGATVILYIILTAKENRGTQLFRHLYCIFFSLSGAGLVFAFRNLSILPLVSTLLLSLFAAYIYTHLRPVTLRTFKPKLKWGIIIAAFVICAAGIVCSVSLHGFYSMAGGATFKRTVALKPGTYTLRVTEDKPGASSSLKVNLSSQSYTEAALKVKTSLKNITLQPGQAIDFTVPEDSAAVFVTFTATSDIIIKEAVIEGGGTTVPLPLRYKLLPEFIVNRLQGIWVNDNAIQRFIFFRDGIRLGMKSPFVGLGGGAFEGGLFSVADYYYQTKHVHNELIQRFIDGGTLGLLLFAALPAAVFRALWKRRKTEKLRLIYPLLFTSMVLIFLHALIEVDFLMVGFRIAVSLLFALTAAMSEDVIVPGKKSKTVIRAVSVMTFIITAFLSFGSYSAIKMIDRNPTLKSFRNALWMDPFNDIDYKLSYLYATSGMTDPYTVSIQKDYLKTMDKQIAVADALAELYLTSATKDAIKGTEKAELYIHENRVDTNAWNHILSLYLMVMNSPDTDGVVHNAVTESLSRLLTYLDELNTTLPLKISPDPDLLSLIRASLGLQEQ